MASTKSKRRIVATRSLERELHTSCSRWGVSKSCYAGLLTTAKLRLSGKTHLLIVMAWEDATDELLLTLGKHHQAATKRFLLVGRNLPAEAVVERISRLHVRDPHRLHVASVRNAKQRRALMSRLARGFKQGADRPGILDAWIEPNTLVVLSPGFERLRVPLDLLRERVPGMEGLSDEEFSEFEIGADGAYLHWPRPDAHLSWESLERLVDPAAQVAALDGSWALYGSAIRKLRRDRGLSQADIPGLTERHLRRIETGQQRLTSKAVASLAKAHGDTTRVYLERLAKTLTLLDTPASRQGE
jgi:hypothetical protein